MCSRQRRVRSSEWRESQRRDCFEGRARSSENHLKTCSFRIRNEDVDFQSSNEKGCAHRADCPQSEFFPLRLSSTSYLSECHSIARKFAIAWYANQLLES